MALALYRKYRPQTFGDIKEQVHIRVTLEHEIESGKIAHAYLFAGPRGVGKTTTARIFAKAVNCTNRTGAEPCLTCPACLAIGENRAVDILEIDAASHTGVDAVRENVIENVRFTPSQLKYKVYIIDEVHMLSTAAFNALLKTLEEPPAHAIFILATTETHKVPATILSRCQRFDFKKIAVPQLVERLALLAAREEVEVDPKVLTAVARAAEGSVRDAESLLGQVLAIGEKKITLEEASLVLPHSDVAHARALLQALHDRRGGDALRQVDTLVAEGVDVERFVADLLALVRLGMLAAFSETSGLADYDGEMATFVQDVLAKWPLPRLTSTLDVLLVTADRVKRGDGSPLPLEMAVVELLASVEPGVQTLPPPPAQPRPPAPPLAPVTQAVPTPPLAPITPPVEVPVPELIVSAPEPVTLVEEVPTPTDRIVTFDLTVEQIQEKWKTLVAAVDEMNHSLPFVLNSTRPQRIEGNTLVLGVPFAFHKDRIMDAKNHDILVAACLKVFGAQPRLAAEVVEGLQDPQSEVENVHIDDPVIKNVLDAFGGRVVS